jgi:uncharacterized membrane protein
MHARRVEWIVLAGLGILLAVELAFYLPQLPDPLATHFDFEGTASGWSSKFGFVVSALVLAALFAALFAGAGHIGKVPDRFINLPNKDYWLAAGRREATMASLTGWLRWILLTTSAFIVLAFCLALRANLATPPRMAGFFGWVLLAYLAFVLVAIRLLLRRFLARP